MEPEERYIALGAALKLIDPYLASESDGADVAQDIIAELIAAPAADVVPVVRCRDCKAALIEDEQEIWCTGLGSPARLVAVDDFCSRGLKKGGD